MQLMQPSMHCPLHYAACIRRFLADSSQILGSKTQHVTQGVYKMRTQDESLPREWRYCIDPEESLPHCRMASIVRNLLRSSSSMGADTAGESRSLHGADSMKNSPSFSDFSAGAATDGQCPAVISFFHS